MNIYPDWLMTGSGGPPGPGGDITIVVVGGEIIASIDEFTVMGEVVEPVIAANFIEETLIGTL